MSQNKSPIRPLKARAIWVAVSGALAVGVTPNVLAQVTLPEVKVTAEADKSYDTKQVITATKTETELRDVPQSITVVNQNQIRDTSSKGLSEALRFVPGVSFAQGEGNRDTPIFRGISTTADFFVDGVRDDVQYYRDLYNVEQVEVFKGPNAMTFGRGATGGLINRVTKVANWSASKAADITLGSWNNRRATFDVNQPLSDTVAIRLTGLYEDSDSYRDGVNITRKGINPTLSWRASPKTLVSLGYERFEDDRIADRGIPSFLGAPLATDRSKFFGNAGGSPTWTKLDSLTAVVDHTFDNGIQLRNRTRYTDQDKFYQNVFPGAVNAAGTTVSISAYNNLTSRKSFVNQTDLTFNFNTGSVKHKFLAGAEFSQQDTENFRMTGFFPGNATSVSVPVTTATTSLPVSYSQSASDANNTGTAKSAAFYVQDQIELNPNWQLIAGLRYEELKIDFLNNRNGDRFKSNDGTLSPRVGVIYKPIVPVSIYANYSEAYMPRAGEQLSSLSLSNAGLDPEKFKNYEIGAKWDITNSLAANAAIFRLDRSNVVVLDPTDPAGVRTILSKGQRFEGFELGLTGYLTRAWSIAGGYAYTDAKFIADISNTVRSGAEVAMVPKHTFTVWNRYDFNDVWGAGVGLIHRTKSLASNEQIATVANPIPNVELPSYTRVDAAVFWKIDRNWKAQLNVENIFDEKYYTNAYNNNNITPGSPRAVRVGLRMKF